MHIKLFGFGFWKGYRLRAKIKRSLPRSISDNMSFTIGGYKSLAPSVRIDVVGGKMLVHARKVMKLVQTEMNTHESQLSQEHILRLTLLEPEKLGGD